VTQAAPAKLSDSYVLSMEYQAFDDVFLSAEAFHKKGDRLWDYYGNFLDEFEFAPESRYDRVAVPSRSSRARGLELVLRKRPAGAGWRWMVNYAWNKTLQTIDETRLDPTVVIPAPYVLPAPWDQRHAIKLMLGYGSDKKWQIAGTWHYHSGWPISDVEVAEMSPSPDGPNLGVRVHWFAERTPIYHRLDLRLSRFVQRRSGHKLHFFLDIINAYDRDNLRGYGDVTYNYVSKAIKTELTNREEWLPILPTFGFWWRF